MRKSFRQALIVLGMHRSGSSAMGGVLANLGAQAPKSLMPPSKDNPRGYWESTALMQFHDRVLASAGSTWHDWSEFNAGWLESPVSAEYQVELPRIIAEEFADAPLMLVKDPRICRLLPLWLTVLQSMEVTPKFILPLRHPLEVSSSLEARDSFESSRSILLWLRHVLDAEHDSRGSSRVFVRYTDILSDWRTQIRKVSEALDISWPKWSADSEVAIDKYLSAGLRHHAEDEFGSGEPHLVAWARDAFAALAKLADDINDTNAMATLDAIRADLNASSELFAAVAREAESRAAHERRQRERVSAEATRRMASLEEQLQKREATHAAELAAAKQQIASSLADLQIRLAASEQVLGHARREQESALQLHESTQASLRDQLAARDVRIVDLQQRLAAVGQALDLARREQELELRAHEAALDGLRAQLMARDQRIEGLAAELSSVREAAARKDVDIAERFGEIASLTRLLTQREHAMEQAEVQRRVLGNAIDKQKGRLATLEKQLAEARKRAAAMGESLATAKARLLAGEQAQQEQKAELSRLQSSLSWRVTAPLRRVGRIGRRLSTATRHQGDLELVRATDLFDAGWYLGANPDVAAAGIDPAEHYVQHGGLEGRDPGPRFASSRYLETYPDVAAARMNPLVHYLRHGQAEGRTIPGTSR